MKLKLPQLNETWYWNRRDRDSIPYFFEKCKNQLPLDYANWLYNYMINNKFRKIK